MLTLERENRKAARNQHVSQVMRGRKIIEDGVAAFIARQLRDAAQELRERGIAKRSAVFDPRAWDQRLLGMLAPPLARVMAYGAMTEYLRRRRRRRGTKTTAGDFLSELGVDFVPFETEMPDDLVAAIEESLAANFQRPYWATAVNNTTANKIEAILLHGSTEGLSTRDMAQLIEENAEGYSRQRATLVARTEASAVLTEGRVLGIEALELETGEAFGIEWLSVMGTTTRADHAALDGVQIPTGGTFNLGGESCRFPGDPSLSVGQRANCLCSIIGGSGEVTAGDLDD